MKKFFAAILLSLSCSAAFAQSYEIQDGGVISNTMLTYWCDSSNATFTTYYWLKNTSSVPVTGKTYKRIYQLNDPSAQCWWCVGVNCYPANFTQSGDFTLGGNSGTMLTIDFNPHGHLGTTIVRYVAVNNANTADSTYIDITYNMPGGPASVNVHSASSASVELFPNPSNGAFQVKYDFGNSTPGEGRFSFYDATGVLVKEMQVDDPSGIFHFEDAELAAGIYYGVFAVNDAVLFTKEIVITR